MNQLLLRYTSFDAGQFDGDAENRGNAGLTLLQRWQETDGAATWLLFSINDADKARSWLSQADSLGHAPAEAHFLRTA
ncbi:hypothetical protein SAMN04488105_106111 [Salipiger thiooxidans]|uniref:Uncharacterized protein n=1 Tax=Salipiger thiooxidans TaxID=282683 RepID=A0A1G7EX07_9RHOB|nr:hypothetical protein [Salipiger thiooxidans]SDE67976.1 hypothetical protein SAMN04488105_106111 [Salipiger thiooxidans]